MNEYTVLIVLIVIITQTLSTHCRMDLTLLPLPSTGCVRSCSFYSIFYVAHKFYEPTATSAESRRRKSSVTTPVKYYWAAIALLSKCGLFGLTFLVCSREEGKVNMNRRKIMKRGFNIC